MDHYSVSTEELDDGTRVVVVEGEIDMAVASAFQAQLVELLEGDGPALLDLTGVKYMDSTAIGALIGARRPANMNRERFALVCGPGDIRRMIEYTGLEKAFAVAETRESARASLA